jgi:hypothetical protein
MEKVDFIFIFAVFILTISLFVLFITVSRFTGYATGTANLTIESQTAINFTTASINWGSGKVTQGFSSATISSNGHMINGNWTIVNSGLVLANIGNVNVTLDLQAGKTAATFIGGSNPAYQWNVSNNESGSCTQGIEKRDILVDVNQSAVGRYCGNFSFALASNQIEIDINLTIPDNSLKGALGDIITATATAV